MGLERLCQCVRAAALRAEDLRRLPGRAVTGLGGAGGACGRALTAHLFACRRACSQVQARWRPRRHVRVRELKLAVATAVVSLADVARVG